MLFPYYNDWSLYAASKYKKRKIKCIFRFRNEPISKAIG